jgi:hypothetical protein
VKYNSPLLLIAAIAFIPNRFPVLGTTGGRPAGTV